MCMRIPLPLSCACLLYTSKLASFDEKFSVVGLLVGHLGTRFYAYYEMDLYVTTLSLIHI